MGLSALLLPATSTTVAMPAPMSEVKLPPAEVTPRFAAVPSVPGSICGRPGPAAVIGSLLTDTLSALGWAGSELPLAGCGTCRALDEPVGRELDLVAAVPCRDSRVFSIGRESSRPSARLGSVVTSLVEILPSVLRDGLHVIGGPDMIKGGRLAVTAEDTLSIAALIVPSTNEASRIDVDIGVLCPLPTLVARPVILALPARPIMLVE